MRFEANFQEIWSGTRYLKRCFLSIANEYFLAICSKIRYLKLIYQSKAKFSIWSEFYCDMQRFYCDMKRVFFRYEANFIAMYISTIPIQFQFNFISKKSIPIQFQFHPLEVNSNSVWPQPCLCSYVIYYMPFVHESLPLQETYSFNIF